MGDSTNMTIEFLRARLLSERSVSRIARQRADELAKRVMELEEQLKIVSVQKMKAEKTTADVLAVLDNHGISDVSEDLDSCSDQDGFPCESKASDPFKKKEEIPMNSKMKRNETEGFSGSELESSPSTAGSLSWKSNKDSVHSHGKRNVSSSIRRRSGFASTDNSSTKQRQGRSCRQIRRRESRSAVEESKVESAIPDAEDSGASKHSEDIHSSFNSRSGISEEGSQNQGKRDSRETIISVSSDEERKHSSSDNYNDGQGGEKDMARALEHQAELIGRYEAEEKAQREWEEKFRENNDSTPDSCEPGNCSDVTEERDECKAQVLDGKLDSVAPESSIKAEGSHFTAESAKTQPNGFQKPLHVDDQKVSRTPGHASPPSDIAFPRAKGEQIEKRSGKEPSLSVQLSSGSTLLQNQSANAAASSPSDGSIPSTDLASGSNKKELALMSTETSATVGGVLEALQQARLSLKQKLTALPFREGRSAGTAFDPCFSALRAPEKSEIPTGCAQLFRVPSDFEFEAAKPKIMGSGSQIGFSDYYPHIRNTLASADRFAANPHLETRLNASADGQLISSQQINGWSRISKSSSDPYPERGGDQLAPSAYMDSRMGASAGGQYHPSPYTENLPGFSAFSLPSRHYLDASVPSPSRFTFPVHPEQMPRMRSVEGYFKPLSSRPIDELLPTERFSSYDNHSRPNMYR